MAIPNDEKKERVLKAIDHIDIHGVPERRRSIKYDLLFNGTLYPPKYVIELADLYEDGVLKDTAGNRIDMHSLLESLGFQILYPTNGTDREQYNRPFPSKTVLVLEQEKTKFIPKLEPSKRSREYNNYRDDEKDTIVYEYLFHSMSHRWLDEHILGIPLDKRTGHESMNILHFIGLKDKHKGIFKDYSINEAIGMLSQQGTEFSLVIKSLQRYEQKGVLKEIENRYTYAALGEIETSVLTDSVTKEITETEKEQIYKSRIGQSAFKKALLAVEKRCSLCGVSDERFLIASHIKPWSQSSHQERLDINNGLLLCPNHDAVFDKGFISFNEKGEIIISNSLGEPTRLSLSINSTMKVAFNEKQLKYIKWHRENLFRVEQLA
ncbi:HNH endonuclease [Neobacillus pocheonensis]|uniref:HNH endonuclease n=1 Tax=Neobacillus pocheonensis TaxID=363869 RepID=UPI003D2D3EEB